MITLGERIRELREGADFSLREFARLLKISAAFLSDIELGRRFPSDDLLARLAKRLGTTEDDLREFDSRPPLDDLKRRSAQDPTYGFALRRMIEDDVSAEDLIEMLDERGKKSRR